MQHVNPSSPHSAKPPVERRINVMQGTCHVTGEPDVVLTTVLGSCIAVCLYDPFARVGGMNHFLLSQPTSHDHGSEAQRYGVYAMEVLVNDMLKAGAARSRIKAHVYGGANLHPGMRSIGSDNAAFAMQFLKEDGIPVMHSHVGGAEARRVDFRAASGQARCKVVHNVVVKERRIPPPATKGTGDVELF